MAIARFLAPAALLTAGALGVWATRAPLVAQEAKVRERDAVYTLPPPEQLKVMTLGYDAAVADLLWAHVLVAQGLRNREGRRFDTLLPLYEAITELAPDFRRPYLLSSALVTFQSSETPIEEIIATRQIIEKGTRNLPYDADIWLLLGQFVAYIAPAAYLEDPEMKEQWKLDGARYLAHAAALEGNNAHGWSIIGAAGILHRDGQRDAVIQLLQRQLALADDPELKAELEEKLRALLDERQQREYFKRVQAFEELTQEVSPYGTRTQQLVLGPPVNTALCAGPAAAAADTADCAYSWRDWSERFDRSIASEPELDIAGTEVAPSDSSHDDAGSPP